MVPVKGSGTRNCMQAMSVVHLIPQVHFILQAWYYMFIPCYRFGTTCSFHVTGLVPHVHSMLQAWYHMFISCYRLGTTCSFQIG